MNISKEIQKVFRKLVRKYNDEKIEEVLKEFADLGRLDNISQHSQPKNETSTKIDAAKITELLQTVYETDDAELVVDFSKIRDIFELGLSDPS